MKANPVGFHTSLDENVMNHILQHVEGNYVVGQVARMAMIPRETLRRWLKRGEEEANRAEFTIFAQLWARFEEKRGFEIKSMLEDVRGRKTNWQAIWELLKSVAKEDFGVDAIEYKELLEKIEKLSQAFVKLSEDSLHGVVDNGKLDSEGD